MTLFATGGAQDASYVSWRATGVSGPVRLVSRVQDALGFPM